MLVQEAAKRSKNKEISSSPFRYSDFAISSSLFQIENKENEHKVSKSYEVQGKTISESFFETNYGEEDLDFVQDFAQSHKKGIILIITEKMNEDEINFFIRNMKGKVKFIIYYQGEPSQMNIMHTRNLTFIKTFSIKAAIATAYKKAKSGQAIVLPKVDANFDFFRYIEYLN